MIKLRAFIGLTFVAVMLGITAIAAQAEKTMSKPAEHTVEITGFKFIPESLTVKAGDSITWINRDIAPHTATANDESFDTGELKQNESAKISVTADQTIGYFCRYHPAMKAEIAFQ